MGKRKRSSKESEVSILAKLQKLISAEIELYDKCKFHEAARAIDDYLINSVSQVYIPITREELWQKITKRTEGLQYMQHLQRYYEI